jgi:hypothetical protein
MRPASPAPWGAFPLSELCVLAGLVFAVAGFVVVSGALMACGLTLAVLAGIELTLRERRRARGLRRWR